MGGEENEVCGDIDGKDVAVEETAEKSPESISSMVSTNPSTAPTQEQVGKMSPSPKADISKNNTACMIAGDDGSFRETPSISDAVPKPISIKNLDTDVIASPSLPPNDFDVICSEERDLLGNFLVRDLIFHRGSRLLTQSSTESNPNDEDVVGIAKDIIAVINHGLKFVIAGDGRYGGGRFLKRIASPELVKGGTCAEYRELGANEALAYIVKLFRDIISQAANDEKTLLSIGSSSEQRKKDVSADAHSGKKEQTSSSDEPTRKKEEESHILRDADAVKRNCANDNDVLLLNASISYGEENEYASHKGNKQFCEFLDTTARGLEVNGLDTSIAAACARAQLSVSAVNFVMNEKKGRFLAQKVNGGEWIDLDELTVVETSTVLLWRRFLERERLRLKSPPCSESKTAEQKVDAAAKPEAPKKPSAKTSHSRWPSHYEVVPPSTVPVEKPTDHDVLFGRGGLTNHHPGNKRFRDIIAVQRPDYIAAIKIEKPNVARKIVRAIRCGNPAGRFLKKNSKNGMWYDVGDRHAAEKASQALREKSQAEKYDQIALKKQAEARIKGGSEMTKSSIGPFGSHTDGAAMGMPPLNAGFGMNGSPVPPHGTPLQPDEANRLPNQSAHIPPIMPTSGIKTSPPHVMPFRQMSNPMMAAMPPGKGYPPPPGHPLGFGPHPPQLLPPHMFPRTAESNDGQKEEKACGDKRKASDQDQGQIDQDSNKKQKSLEGTVPSSDSSPKQKYEGDVHPVDEHGNIVVTDHDILCGRGGLTNHHLGNKRFRDIVSLHRPDYIRAPKIEKPSVARLIVAAIRNGNPPGRFLKKDPATGKWHDIGDKRAAEKASQALREKTPEERLKLAAKHDRPMPTRQYFSHASATAELPFSTDTGNDKPSAQAENEQSSNGKSPRASPKEENSESVAEV